MENARRAAFSFFPKRSGGCAPEAFVVAKQPSAVLSITRRKFRPMTCGALAAFWKVEMFLSRCSADAPGKNERVAPRPRRFHYERAYRASTFEITNLSTQKTRYVSGPLIHYSSFKSLLAVTVGDGWLMQLRSCCFFFISSQLRLLCLPFWTTITILFVGCNKGLGAIIIMFQQKRQNSKCVKLYCVSVQ